MDLGSVLAHLKAHPAATVGGLTAAGLGVAGIADALNGEQSATEALVDAGLIGSSGLAALAAAHPGGWLSEGIHRMAAGPADQAADAAAYADAHERYRGRGRLAGAIAGALGAAVPSAIYMMNDQSQQQQPAVVVRPAR